MGVEFEKNPSNRRRFIVVKILCSYSNMPFVIDRRNQTYTKCGACALSDKYVVSEEFLE